MAIAPSKVPLVSYKGFNFFIIDRPSNATLPQTVDLFKKYNVKDVIRVCEPSYKKDLFEQAGIAVHDWQFADGSPPPQEVIDHWLELLRERYNESTECYFAVHCVAGLGRGPVMVAIALMELGMKYEDTIELIRKKRKGALNQKQLSYLASYKLSNKLRSRRSNCPVS